MPDIVIVDTTVFLNLLNVPHHNDRKNDIDRQFEAFLDAGARFILPLAVVFQAGDHVSNLQKGNQRRHWSIVLRDQVRKALAKEAPWALAPLPNSNSIEEWLLAFPEFSVKGRGYGTSLLSIVRIWEIEHKRHPARGVCIWSTNSRLEDYRCDVT